MKDRFMNHVESMHVDNDNKVIHIAMRDFPSVRIAVTPDLESFETPDRKVHIAFICQNMEDRSALFALIEECGHDDMNNYLTGMVESSFISTKVRNTWTDFNPLSGESASKGDTK